MATTVERKMLNSGSLSNDEAATLIGIILASTNILVPSVPRVPDSSRSLDDLFPVDVLARSS